MFKPGEIEFHSSIHSNIHTPVEDAAMQDASHPTGSNLGLSGLSVLHKH